MSFNPYTNIARGKGVDLPILKVYLAGRIAGNCIDKCLEWRKKIVNHYRDYEWNEETESYSSYPIAFLDALNSKEADSIDEKGLTSSLSPNLIYDKDLLSIKTADVIVANMEDFLEEGIEEDLSYDKDNPNDICEYTHQPYFNLKEAILNRRENLGTIMEVGIALYLQKPVILIVPEKRKEIFEKHPFTKRASVIVTSVEKLIEKKWLSILYKSISGATYE